MSWLVLVASNFLCFTFTNLPGVTTVWCDRPDTFRSRYWHKEVVTVKLLTLQGFQALDPISSCAS
ncbi:MAG: hypothetical protein HC894_08500 [Microcoleus sp. SM1_3_4]|nr:hypothetical protein [Microcoleus sp. SM1_3_4]